MTNLSSIEQENDLSFFCSMDTISKLTLTPFNYTWHLSNDEWTKKTIIFQKTES